MNKQYVRRLFIFVVFANVVLAVHLHGQTSQTSQKSQTDITSDPVTLSNMHKALDAMGGEQVWSTQHAASSHASVTDLQKNTKHELYMIDDWSTDEVRYRRRIPGGNQPTTEHAGGKSWTVTRSGIERKVPEFDQASTLVLHLPGAAAMILINHNKEYILRNSPSRLCTTDNLCIDVYRRSDSGVIMLIQRWELSQSTYLPTTISIRLHGPNVSARPMWETVTYNKYLTSGSIINPTELEVVYPNHAVRSFVLESPVFKEKYDTAIFDQEHANE